MIAKNKKRRMARNDGGLIGLDLGIVDHQVHDPGDGDDACTLHADIQTETLNHRWAGSASAAWEACFSPQVCRNVAARFVGFCP